MANKFNTKRTFGSLFTSLIIHSLVLIVLGFVFLKGESNEEYIEVKFTAPLPKSRHKLQAKKPVKMLMNPSSSRYENVIREQIPEITTVAKINDYSDVYLSPAPFGENRTPTMAVPKAHRITIPKAQVQSRVKVSFTRPEITHKAHIEMASLVVSTELKLPSTLSAVKKIDAGVDAIRKYREAIKRKIEKEKRYPNLAEENGYEGKVDVRFKLFADGKVDEVEIIKSSGYQVLDKEAVGAVTRAAPYPPMPKSIKREYIIVEVPIVFRFC